MSPIDSLSLAPLTAGVQAQTPAKAGALEQPRTLKPGQAEEFRAHLEKAMPASPKLSQSFDIEHVLEAHLPPPNASAPEFAMGLLRAQVKVAQAALAIELVNKATQSLSQGVQSLANRQ